jgi:hypothetical protein
MEALAGGKSMHDKIMTVRAPAEADPVPRSNLGRFRPKRPARDRISSFLNFLEEHERVFNLLYSTKQSV